MNTPKIKTDSAEIALVLMEDVYMLDVNVFRDLWTETQNQKAKTEEELKKWEREWGKQTRDYMQEQLKGIIIKAKPREVGPGKIRDIGWKVVVWCTFKKDRGRAEGIGRWYLHASCKKN
jgi:hypothetical protein